ncbi:hypothetical protein B0O99DRAFT_326524 [Bisporella sp. PMI_857]|nr:hypothetical protein B0O99DRAFT_326524 [Bisporella sp. PMI_857]
MSWMEHRETTRGEDKAYSMLGILDISMSSIYGEGMENAFDRLLDKLENRSKKRQHNELFVVTQGVISSTKRLKTAHPHSPSVLSHSGTNDSNTKSCVVHSIDYTTKEALINMLHFDKIDERLTSLTAAQGSTCRWFLGKSEYISWHDAAQQSDHGGFLWIKGNPGTGKSTLMKLLFEEEKLYPKSHSSQITLSFFFLARGTIEEKSTIGLYRSLLHQLLERAPDLSDCLDWMTANGARGIKRSGWHEQALKQTLAKAIQKLKSRPLTIFADALDECDKSKAAGMVSFFEELCDIAKANQTCLKICFSSRHYPTITIQNGIEVTLENEGGHMEDIKQYVKAKLKIGKSKQAESLRSDILEKSSGIFLWVVLVIDIINSEYPDKSISIKKIRERLREIPPELNDLFEMILTRDGENLEQMQICLKFILFASRPLKPQELYFATQVGLDRSCSGRWDREDVELDNMKTFVKSSSKGLAEVIRNKAAEVQSSTTQLNASISQDVNIPDPLPQASESAHLREEISSKFPFLEYSTRNIFTMPIALNRLG